MPSPKKAFFEYRFDSPFSAERIDRAGGVIHDVSLITMGVKARGHELHTDEVTLQQMEKCAQERGKVPVKLNHQSGVENVCGFVTNVRRVGLKLLGDWHLLKTHAEFNAMMERAERMPETFGLSAAFMGEAEVKDGKPRARCSELLAVDCVAQPAANPSGLFEAKPGGVVDTKKGGMSDTATDPNAVPAEMPAWFKPFADKLDSIASRQEEISAYQQQAQQEAIARELLAMSPEDRAALTDDELSQYGITREEIAEIDALTASMGEGGGEASPEGGTPTGGTEGAAAPGGGTGRSGTVPGGRGNSEATAATVASLKAEIKNLVNFQRRIEKEKATELEAKELARREEILTTLEEKTSALLVELKAKDEIIKRYEQAGVRLAASREGMNLFSSKPNERKNEFEMLCAARLEELKAEHPKAALTQLQARAVRETIRTHREAYLAHREGSIELGR